MGDEHAQRSTSYVWLVVLRSSAFTVSALAVFLSFVNMVRHIRENHHRLLQKYTVRILFMVPLYSVTSCVALLLPGRQVISEVLHILRMLWETVVIFSFLQFILACAGGARLLVARFRKPDKAERKPAADVGTNGPSESEEDLEDSPPSSEEDGDDDWTGESVSSSVESLDGLVAAVDAPSRDSSAGFSSGADRLQELQRRSSSARSLRDLQHLPVLDRCLPPWRSARQMLKWCIRGTFSYIIVGVCYVVVVVVVMSLEAASEDGEVPGEAAVMVVAQTCLVLSQTSAITALTTLGVNMMEDLKPLHCHWKFLSVKLVIFFTFWQGLMLRGLQSIGALKPLVDADLHWSSPADVSRSFQNWLICFEMFIASVLHFPVWPPHDYLTMLAHLEMKRDRGLESEDFVRENSAGAAAAAVDLRDIIGTLQTVRRVHSSGSGLPGEM